jgi:hypothetical protein
VVIHEVEAIRFHGMVAILEASSASQSHTVGHSQLTSKLPSVSRESVFLR